MPRRTFIFSVLTLTLFALAPLFKSCDNNSEKYYYRIQNEALGTFYSVTYRDSLERNLTPQVDSLLSAVEKIYSIYDSTSAISRFNQTIDSLHHPALAQLTQTALQLYELSGHYFDPTVAPLAKLWGFGETDFVAADTAAALNALVYCGMHLIEIRNGTLYKRDPRTRMTLNAIAKGYAVDLTAQLLEQLGIKNYLIEIGGELRGKGVSSRGKEWVVGIEYPKPLLPPHTEIVERINLSKGAIATSGNYRQFIESQGKKWGHIINPKTGLPEVNDLLSASVYANDCTTADALATALMAMGSEKAKRLIEQNPNIEGMLIYLDKDSIVNNWKSAGMPTVPAGR